MSIMESWTVDYFEENTEHCLNILNNQQFVEQIPLLNTITDCAAYNKKLVRFRGMIQDILNPVYYMEKFKVRNLETDAVSYRSGRYWDFIDIKDNEEIISDNSEKKFCEKHIMHCVQVPYVNSWVKQFRFVDDQSNVTRREGKRKLSQNDTEMDVEENILQDQSPKSNKKRSIEGQTRECSGNESCPSILSAGRSELDSICLANELDGVPGVLLNIYDCKNSNVLVNDVLEAVGFLSVRLDGESMDEESDNPYNSLPKIHVINLIPAPSIFDSMLKLHKDYIFSNALNLRDDLWIMLADILLGDTLAADYLICHLISFVHLRKVPHALGKFSLNISNVPDTFRDFDYVSSLYKFLAHLLEKSLYISLTIPYLNSTEMIPKQNHNENRLITGLLQVPLKTHIIVDETKLEPGQLFDRGVRNVQALSDVITKQRLEYDFEFYKLPFNTDIPVLTLSKGKSLLPNDFHLILDPDESCIQNVGDSFTRAWDKMADPLLSKLRVYLNNISTIDYNVTPAMQETMENDFVRMRQDANSHISAEDFYKLIALSRWMALSRGMNSLEKDIWEQACRMESQRKARL